MEAVLRELEDIKPIVKNIARERQRAPGDCDVTRQEFANLKAIVEALVDIIKINMGLSTELIRMAIRNVDTYAGMEGSNDEILELRCNTLVKLLKEQLEVKPSSKPAHGPNPKQVGKQKGKRIGKQTTKGA